MQKNSHLKKITFLAVLAAMSIVLTRFLAINFTSSIRFSLGNIPIILASVTFGPIAGMATGVVADLVGSIFIQGGFNPLITVMPALMGLLPWFFKKFLPIKNRFLSTFTAIFLSDLLANIIVGTLMLHLAFSAPIMSLLPVRAPLYAGVAVAETVIVYFIDKSKVLERIKH